jgi:hypothetical protein
MKITRTLTFLTIATLVVACSSSHGTDEEYWFAKGERFGSLGYSYDNDKLTLLKEKVPFDEAAYLSGYEKGKEEFCDPYQAFEKGMQGQQYQGQCEGMKHEALIEADWRRGWDAFIGADFYKFR